MIANQFQEGSELLAAYPNLDGVVALTHGSGCGMAGFGEGFDLLRRTLSGYARHPNFAGLLVLGLGCEVNQVRSLTEGFDLPSSTPFLSMTIQEMGGTRATVREATARLRDLAEEANKAERSPVPASELVLGPGVWWVRRLLGHNRQPGAGRGGRPVGPARRDGCARRDARDLRRRTPADQAGHQPRSRANASSRGSAGGRTT